MRIIQRNTSWKVLVDVVAAPSESDRLANYTLINDEVKYRLSLQREAGDRVDTKTTLLLGFAAAAAQLLVANGAKAHEGLLSGALVAYAGAFGLGMGGIYLLPYYDAPEPRHLVATYANSFVDETLAALIGIRIVAVEKNRLRHQRKTAAWGCCLVFFTVGVFLTTWALLEGPIA